MSEFQPVFDLVASVYTQALKDAKRGDLSAIAWLDMMRPDWRELEKRREIDRKQRGNKPQCSVTEGKSSVFVPEFQCF